MIVQPAQRQYNKGFTLLEVLVAFTILGLSLGVLLQTFAVGLRNTALSEEYTLATLHAESLLAKIGVEESLQEGSLQGEIDDKFTWQAEISEFIEEDESGLGVVDARGLKATLYYVQLTVNWRADNDKMRTVVLDTLRAAVDDSGRGQR